MTRLISDETWAALTIWQEARGEPYDGKLGVAEVIHTRVLRHFDCDGTVVGAVLGPYQFSGWDTKDPNRRECAMLDDGDSLFALCRQAWRDVLAGTSVVPAAVFYYNPSSVPVTPTWATPEKLVRIIGAHHFFRA